MPSRRTAGQHDARAGTTPGVKPEAVRVCMLGGFSVSVGARTVGEDGWRLKKAASLVKMLALAPRHRMHRERAMDLLWPGLDPEAAANNLRHALHVARRVLDPAPTTAPCYLRMGGSELALCPEGPLWVDVAAFEEAAAAARRSQGPAAYRAALDLYAGDLLTGDPYEHWVEEKREGLRRSHLVLLVELAGLYEERGETEEAVDTLRRVVAEEPAHEEAHAGLMRLHATSGRRREALAWYERLREVLNREFGVEPGAATRRLREEIRAGRFPVESAPSSGRPPNETPGTRRHNLPAALTSFVGRERALVEVKRLLSMTRLLTLTGAGGCGKTRLALEVAGDLVGAYPDGVWLVELAALTEPELVPRAVASALGVRERPGRSLTATLTDALSSKKLLLVLDNCEHLVGSCARFVVEALTACPELRVLATSREILGVAGEAGWPVPPLSVPDRERLPSVEGLTRYEAVGLFVERARHRLPAFELTQSNARAVAEVCRRLDGIPLAIELATARVTVLAVEQVAERLGVSLKLLDAGDRAPDPRHRTLRATLEWSYVLLSEPERRLFVRLSTFIGGFSLEAAEALGPGDGIEEGDVLDLLGGLVDKSLVLAEEQDGALRYRMLEPVRQYGRERLEESGESEAVRYRHATWFLALAEEAEPELRRARQAVWLEQLEREHDNLRATLSWSLKHEEPEVRLRLGAALGEFWHLRGHLSEGRRWLEAALASSDDAPPTPARARALARAGYVAWEQGDYERSVALSEESLALSRELGDDTGAAIALQTLGWAALFGNETGRASALAEEAMALQRTSGDTLGVVRSLLILGFSVNAQHDFERALKLHEESMALAREANDGFAIVLSLALGGFACVSRGDHGRAKALCEEGLDLSQKLKTMHLTAAHLHLSATLAGVEGRTARSARLWGSAEALRETIGTILSPVEHYFYDPYIDAARVRLDESAWEAAWAEGRAMSLEEAVEYALSEVEADAASMSGQPPACKPSGSPLTRRQEEVSVLVARGMTNRQVAARLKLSEHTVTTHVRDILKKLGLHSRTQLAAWVMDRGPLP